MPGNHIIVGGGLAGLMTAMKLAEQGEKVDLFSIVPVKRSHSVCAQGGINGAVNTKGEGDSPRFISTTTVYGGDFLAEPASGQSDVRRRARHHLPLDRMGVMFNPHPRGADRFSPLRRHASTIAPRFAGATTGQQLLYASGRAGAPLRGRGSDSQVRRMGDDQHRAGRVGRLQRHLRHR